MSTRKVHVDMDRELKENGLSLISGAGVARPGRGLVAKSCEGIVSLGTTMIHYMTRKVQAPVVRRVDNGIHRINGYQNQQCYLSDLHGGKGYWLNHRGQNDRADYAN